tara:strand:- start:269 stop:505 length:237 start_codon:yes stop_codon:yes gene_type:complete
MNKARKILEKSIKYLFNVLIIILSIAALTLPAVLPFIVEFHPLLVAPYYGILWWISSLHYVARKNLEFHITSLLEEEE